MEVHGRQQGDLRGPRTRAERARTDRARDQAERTGHGHGAHRHEPVGGLTEKEGTGAAGPVEPGQGAPPRDVLELSDIADRLREEPAPRRAAELAELREAYRSGELFTAARLERAAEGLLSSQG